MECNLGTSRDEVLWYTPSLHVSSACSPPEEEQKVDVTSLRVCFALFSLFLPIAADTDGLFLIHSCHCLLRGRGSWPHRLTAELVPQAGREAAAQNTGAPRGNIILPELNKELSV